MIAHVRKSFVRSLFVNYSVAATALTYLFVGGIAHRINTQ